MPQIDQRKFALVSQELREVFGKYKADNLSPDKASALEDYISSKINTIDWHIENYPPAELSSQRDLSGKFHWGHTHDFGKFKITGRMGYRHFNILATFLSVFPFSVTDLRGKTVFDIGCWTGGTSLLLAALGSRVVAIEEVKKYADATAFLIDTFDIGSAVSVAARSIYQCDNSEYYSKFDIVYCTGVLYHLSDPIVGLRILFNSLKVDGVVFLESAGIKCGGSVCRFDGSRVHGAGTKEDLNRGGWNWFVPSRGALCGMMQEVGFDDVEVMWHNKRKSLFCFGRKSTEKGICRAGLSYPTIH